MYSKGEGIFSWWLYNFCSLFWRGFGAMVFILGLALGFHHCSKVCNLSRVLQQTRSFLPRLHERFPRRIWDRLLFTEARSFQSLYWWDVANLQCRASASPGCSVCSGALGHPPFLHELQLLAPYRSPHVPFWMPLLAISLGCWPLLWRLCTHSEKLACGIEKEQLVINRVSWWFCLSGEKKKW